ncbi:MAG: hypothetical protein ABJ360_25550 [Roseobacter sp.]
MSQFIESLDHQQTVLLPEQLEDYVDEHSSVRATDVFVVLRQVV